MSDTPETDAFYSELYTKCVSSGMIEVESGLERKFCRKLERERDALKEKLNDWENAAKHVEENHPDERHCGCVPVLRKLLNDSKKELDALKERLAETENDMQCKLAARELLKEATAEIAEIKKENQTLHDRMYDVLEDLDRIKKEIKQAIL